MLLKEDGVVCNLSELKNRVEAFNCFISHCFTPFVSQLSLCAHCL